jgi:hypothetical protein
MFQQLTGLLASSTSTRGKDTSDALAEFFAGLPRKQQAQFSSKEAGDDPTDADGQIMQLLQEIRKEVTTQTNPFGAGGNIYDHFTSQRLNPQGGS